MDGRVTCVEVRAVWLAAWGVVHSSSGSADVRGAALHLVPVRAGRGGGRRAERARTTWVQNMQHPSDPQRAGKRSEGTQNPNPFTVDPRMLRCTLLHTHGLGITDVTVYFKRTY